MIARNYVITLVSCDQVSAGMGSRDHNEWSHDQAVLMGSCDTSIELHIVQKVTC